MTVETITHLANIVVPVFICVGLGILWARIGTQFDTRLITSLVYNIGAPCLIIATFQKVTLSPSAMAEIALATIACYASFCAISLVLIGSLRLDVPSYLPSLIFPLTGSMGLPVSYYAFGDEGLALAIVYFTFGAIGTFTLGAAIAAGNISIKKMLAAPVVYAVIIATALQLTGVRLPDWIFNTANLLGGMVIPAQLVALGVSLLELRKRGIARSGFLGLFRLAMGVSIGFAIAEVFGLEGAARAIVIIQSAMPVAVSSYLFAQQYNRRPEEVAGMVVVSTAVSLVTLPLLLLAVI
ncbi:MAG: AEC family transporter [Pseudomonadota bacterium]|nr:AEC family transporter [Pseudomonadota bacterium]